MSRPQQRMLCVSAAPVAKYAAKSRSRSELVLPWAADDALGITPSRTNRSQATSYQFRFCPARAATNETVAGG